MDFYSASWTHSEFAGSFAVRSIWVRDVKRKVKSAMRILAVNDVFAFGRFLVANSRLRSNRIAA